MNTTTTTQDVQAQRGEGTWVAIPDITVPEDARVHSPEDINSRAQSMEKEGQLQNILLSKEGDKLVLVYGHGRLLSAQKLGWEKIRADVKEGLTETQKLLMTLAENEERENASPFFTARLYKKIMATEGTTKANELAVKLGRDAGDVSRILALCDLSAEVQEKLERSNFSMGQLREILRLPNDEQQLQLAQECTEKDYSVRELQTRVKHILAGAGPSETKPKVEPPVFNAGGQEFQFTGKGKRFEICTNEKPSRDLLDVYVQNFRCAVVNYLSAQEGGMQQKAA